MEIINLTPNIGTLDNYVYNLGEIKRNLPVTFSIKTLNKQHLQTKVGCGSCTSVKTNVDSDGIISHITYDAKQLGDFSKSITIKFTDGTQQNVRFVGKVK